MSHYESRGLYFEPGDVPVCDVCGCSADEAQLYETPWSGLVLCMDANCLLAVCETEFHPIEFCEEETDE